ncbi:hypothetical protein GCM10010505_67670 [Kitasatospora aburaviensis]
MGVRPAAPGVLEVRTGAPVRTPAAPAPFGPVRPRSVLSGPVRSYSPSDLATMLRITSLVPP